MYGKVLKKIFRGWRYRAVAFVLFLAFVIFYLYSTQFVVFGTLSGRGIGFLLIPEWHELMFRQRMPFVFESVGILKVAPLFSLFVSPLNILIASVMGILIGMNVSVSYFVFRSAGLRGAGGALTLIGTIPALLSGASCCTPTLIAVMGLQLTGTLAALWSWTIPVSFLLMIVSLWWSLRQAARYSGFISDRSRASSVAVTSGSNENQRK